MKSIFRNLFLLALTTSLFSCNIQYSQLVSDLDEFNAAVKVAQPGDVITLSNGVWNNAELLFDAVGTAEMPITLVAEEKGKVFLEGQSNIRISGEYLIVEGLVFRNGYTPTLEVISFMKDDGEYANNCRVTECVIDNYNGNERFEKDTWVAIYGRNNRVDHCYLTGKRNQGVTLTVRLTDTLCQNNNHRIDHNYFGYRQNLGSNGGETMRIGTSHYSLTTSGTLVEANYFEYCDGEHEIISNKSCGNSFLNNTFYECRGTLTYRHGNDNIAEGNFFFGNGKEHTGGIRIINKRNKAINNYFYELKGYRFRGSLVIMNGVPNSAINRYHQVVGGEFLNNTFINCDHIQLCAGSDEERSAIPVDSKVKKNLFYHDNAEKIFTVYDDISGIEFKDNYISNKLKSINQVGIKHSDIKLEKNEFNIYKPTNPELPGIGCTLEKPIANAENTGVKWYPRKDEELKFDTGNIIEVEPGLNTLYDAILTSKSGDIIILKDSGIYKVKKKILVPHPLTVKAENNGGNPIVKAGKSSLFTIENGGSLKLQGLEFDGRYSPDNAGNCIVTTSKYSMNRNYKLIVENCRVKNLDINHSFDFIKVFKNTMADSLVLRNCSFDNVSGNIVSLNKELDELGIYNAEYVIYENCSFKNIQGTGLNLLRGGTDESTFGPSLTIDHCVFDNVGFGKRNKTKVALYIHGVQIANIKNSIFTNTKALQLCLTNGEPITNIENCNFFNSEGIVSNNNFYNKKEISFYKPEFVEGSYSLSPKSKLTGKATDGTNIGLID